MSGFVKGVCEDLCPANEAKLYACIYCINIVLKLFISFRRIKEKLLHYFEYKNGQKHVPGKLVKCFSRSAADKKIPRPQDMRTEACLQRCVEYLLKE